MRVAMRETSTEWHNSARDYEHEVERQLARQPLRHFRGAIYLHLVDAGTKVSLFLRTEVHETQDAVISHPLRAVAALTWRWMPKSNSVTAVPTVYHPRISYIGYTAVSGERRRNG